MDTGSYEKVADFFDDLCPQVMAIGVTYDEFWYGDPRLVGFTIEAAKLKNKSDAMLQDTTAWNQGRYHQIALSTVLSHAFSNSSTAKYPQEPILVAELDERLAKKRQERELKRAHDNFLAVAQMLAARKAAQAPNG